MFNLSKVLWQTYALPTVQPVLGMLQALASGSGLDTDDSQAAAFMDNGLDSLLGNRGRGGGGTTDAATDAATEAAAVQLISMLEAFAAVFSAPVVAAATATAWASLELAGSLTLRPRSKIAISDAEIATSDAEATAMAAAAQVIMLSLLTGAADRDAVVHAGRAAALGVVDRAALADALAAAGDVLPPSEVERLAQRLGLSEYLSGRRDGSRLVDPTELDGLSSALGGAVGDTLGARLADLDPSQLDPHTRAVLSNPDLLAALNHLGNAASPSAPLEPRSVPLASPHALPAPWRSLLDPR